MLHAQSSAEPVYLLSPGTKTDYYGDTVEDWSAPVRSRIPGAEVQEVSSVEEDGVARRLVTDERILFARGRPAISHGSRIESDGVVWSVEGTPTTRRGLAIGEETTAALRRFHGEG